MIKKALLGLIAATLAVLGTSSFSPAAAYKSGTVVLDENTLVLATEVSNDSVTPLVKKIFASKKDSMILFLNTPGGSVDAGNDLLQAMEASGKTFTCVVKFAASMGFVITQLGCQKRIILSNGTLMQHQSSWGLQPQQMRRQKSFIGYIESLIGDIEQRQADRMKISLEEFLKRTDNDYWLYGQQAVAANAADTVGNAVCTPELTRKTHIEDRSVFIFNIQGEVNDCPLIEGFKVLPPPKEDKVEPTPTTTPTATPDKK